MGNLWANLNWIFWGQHEIYWPAFYVWPHQELRPMHSAQQWEQLNWWMTLSKSCGWWQPYKGIIFVCERPLRQDVDEQGRLHNASEPALLCRDGWPVYAWHGVRVPEQVILAPQTLKADQITKEPNAEVRRVMLERFGQDRYIRESGAELINEGVIPCEDSLWCTHTDDQHSARLYRAPLDDDEPLTMVEVINGTLEADGSAHRYWLRVPPNMQTAEQAVKWTLHFDKPKDARVLKQT